MKTLIIKKVEEGIQPPTHSPFPLFVLDAWGDPRVGIWTVDTGLEIVLPVSRLKDDCPTAGPGVSLDIHPVNNVQVLGWSLSGYNVPFGSKLPEGRLVVAVLTPRFEEGKPFAYAQVVESKLAPVRFIQDGLEGGRIVRGDAQVANSTENRDSES